MNKKGSMMKCYSFIYDKLLILSQTETFLINSSPEKIQEKNQNLSQIMPLLMIKY